MDVTISLSPKITKRYMYIHAAENRAVLPWNHNRHDLAGAKVKFIKEVVSIPV